LSNQHNCKQREKKANDLQGQTSETFEPEMLPLMETYSGIKHHSDPSKLKLTNTFKMLLRERALSINPNVATKHRLGSTKSSTLSL
jgi:hypothetical protein